MSGLEAFALYALALQLPGTADGFGSLAGSALRRLLVVPPQLHLAEDSFPLHLLLERFQRLIDIVVAYEHLHLAAFSFSADKRPRQSGTRPISRGNAGAIDGNTEDSAHGASRVVAKV